MRILASGGAGRNEARQGLRRVRVEVGAGPLAAGQPVLMRVPIYPFAHVFRAGSRIRIVVQPPGGNRPAWAFDTVRYPTPPTVTIDRSAAHPSRIVLPVIPGVDGVPSGLPPCPSLKGQPCRDYAPIANGPA